MTEIVDLEMYSAGVPSQRSALSKNTDLELALEETPADAHHHLLDVNLQVFGSVSDAARQIVRRSRVAISGTSVFTCNVDHLMLMDKDERFRAAYRRADVVTIDGAPLALLSKWTGTRGARRVTGVDLTMAMVELAAKDGLRIALVGGAAGRGERAAVNLHGQFPTLPKMFVDSPQMGFQLGDEEDARLVAALNDYAPHVVIVCLGAPKQELWIDRHRDDLPGAALVGAGATIDFLSGHQPRAPHFFQKTGTEAVYRLVTDFRRLWRRYLVRDARFFVLFATIMLGYAVAKMGLTRSLRSHPCGAGQEIADVATPARRCSACVPIEAH
jgi:N-acetylglucosaminyldiphosphoundecaprenol N-acetyl-beta-D-mannosaminyltransferase